MSWIEKINNTVLTVVTGDGEVYKPLYRNSGNNKQDINMNATVVEFSDIDGGYVIRGAIGPKALPYEFIFQGSDHMDIRDSFISTLSDRRAWALSNPHIGSRIVQPISVSIDNSIDNMTVISGQFIETIADINPSSRISERREAEIKLESSIDAGVFASEQLNLTTQDIASTSIVNDSVYSKVKAGSITEFDLGDVSTKIGKANAAFNTIGSKPAQYMAQLANVIRAPSRFYDTIKNRVSVLNGSYTDLQNSITGVPSLGKKVYFEIAASMNLVAIAEANIITLGDVADLQGISLDNEPIVTRRDVLEATTELKLLFDSYITSLGNLQSENDNKLDSYIPDSANLFALESAMVQVIGNLIAMASDAKTEVIYTTKDDIPIVDLVFKLLGTVDNLIIQKFAKDNNLGQNNVMVVEAGTKLYYYI